MILTHMAFFFITRTFTGLVRERASIRLPQAVSGCFGTGISAPGLPAAGRLLPYCPPDCGHSATDFTGGVAPYALDSANTARLWDVALKLIA
jgi:hypothetical protein